MTIITPRAQTPITNLNSLHSSKYRLILTKLPHVQYFCTKATIPAFNIGTVDQPTIFNPIKRPGGAIQHPPLTVEFIVQEDLKNWYELFRWVRECSNYTSFDDYRGPDEHLDSTASMIVMTNANNPKMKFTFDGLWPVSVGDLSFQSSNDEDMKCTASFEFTSMDLQALSSEDTTL